MDNEEVEIRQKIARLVLPVKKTLKNPESSNFWLPGNYTIVIKKLISGDKMIENLMKYIKERIAAEEHSNASLGRWLDKWKTGLSPDPSESGLFLPVFTALQDVHTCQAQKFLRLKAAMNKVVLPHLREYKQVLKRLDIQGIADEFKVVQKPWAQLLDETNRLKRHYYEACKATKDLASYLDRYEMPTSQGLVLMTPAGRKRAEASHKEWKSEAEKCRRLYEAKLNELNALKADYQKGMTAVFQKCLDIEKARYTLFHESFLTLIYELDTRSNMSWLMAWKAMDAAVKNYSVAKELEYFSVTFGPKTPYDWPKFEEFRDRVSQIPSLYE